MKARRDDDFASEIEAHIALDAEPLVDGGLSPDQANAEASRRFGNVTAAREGSHDRQRLRRLDDLRDIRYTLRSLRRSPGFATVAFRIDDAPVPSRLVRLAADQQFRQGERAELNSRVLLLLTRWGMSSGHAFERDTL